jgi:hypothetical protein
MRWTVTTPPAGNILDWPTISTHLRLDETDDQSYIQSLIQPAAEEYAQDALSSSLLSQTITATYYVDDVMPATRYPWSGFDASYYGSWTPQIYQYGSVVSLPRGPVTAISSIVDGQGRTISAYILERQGYLDLLRITASIVYPVTVVYVAGYPDAAHIPYGIKQAILCHIGTLYENRESVAEKNMTPVPHTLQEFYRIKARKIQVG